VKTEKSYVETLEQGIAYYVTPLADSNIPEEIRENWAKISGSITEIYKLHANTLYPALVACGHDIFKISETFDTLIANGKFYCYVPFTWNRDQALSLSQGYDVFFKNTQIGSSVESFMLQIIHRLSCYKFLFEDVNKELIRNRQKVDFKQYLGALCKTEKSVDRMLSFVHDASSIKKIALNGLVSF
jgi:RhoGEF domain